MKFLLGTKEGMTQVFDEDGAAHPATVIKAGPVTVTQIKTEDTDGYTAVQVGYGERKEKNINKAEKGHMGEENFEVLREYRIKEYEDDTELPSVGDTLDVTVFEKGDAVDVSGISKGKGFQGTVKRHGFGGGPRTHGQKHSEREPGSVGATGPQRVLKGKKMPGRMGGGRTTIQNLSVVHIDSDEGAIYIKGAVPGKKGALIEVHPSVKA